MARDLNKCCFIGRLGKDISINTMPSGKSVTNNSLGCGDDYKDSNSGQKVEKTNWVNLVFFDRTADVLAEYCKKGSKLYVEGKLETRKYQDNNGLDQYMTEVKVSYMQMLDGNPNNQSAGQQPQGQQNSGGYQQNQQQNNGGHQQQNNQNQQRNNNQQRPKNQQNSNGFDDFDTDMDIPF